MYHCFPILQMGKLNRRKDVRRQDIITVNYVFLYFRKIGLILIHLLLSVNPSTDYLLFCALVFPSVKWGINNKTHNTVKIYKHCHSSERHLGSLNHLLKNLPTHC